MNIEDRTDLSGDDYPYYIVTGSIRPHFEPEYFESHTKAWQHARKICLYGLKHGIYPAFKPCIEGRNELPL